MDTSADKSFIVQGKGLEEALGRAAVVLHCDRERVSYEILQDARPPRNGQPRQLCKLRVKSGGPMLNGCAPKPPAPGDAVPAVVAVPWPMEELERLPCPLFLACLQESLAMLFVAPPASVASLPPAPPLPLTEMTGTLRAANGPLFHDGDLRLRGHIRQGAQVTVTGALFVVGDVETAALDAGGDIVIDGGLLGTARSARGSISCRFAQGAEIDAPLGDVRVTEAALHCQIEAGGSVTIGDILLGGSCYGEDGIETRIAGSESGMATLLAAGRNKRLRAEGKDLRARALRCIAESRECDQIRQRLLPAEERGVRLPAEDRARLWQALARRVQLQDALRRMASEKSRLLGMINGERGSRISIRERAYPGVKVLIDDLGLELDYVTQYAVFSKDYAAGALRLTPYQ